ncbi:lectin subunit alpha [Culex quinquefasciatus]|uniref:lectin subunit alpha n=1 Tax=Culex quinquefasciatus TaxID=7176 RepID=UPI0018E3AE6A|nr:lectin subunit alpha [Culex quinquefasciatus]
MSNFKHSKKIVLIVVYGLLQVTVQSSNWSYHIPAFRANWFKAVEHCHSLGMQLVTIESKAKNDEVATFINTTESYNKYNYWIGGSDLAQKFSFKWLATGKPFEYTNWSANEPNNANNNEDCVHIVHQPQLRQFWTWNDHRCSKELDFLCENIASPVSGDSSEIKFFK